MSNKIRVVLADDEPSYRKALEKTLQLMGECELVAVCKDGQEALDACLADPPEVLLTDINMPNLSGIELTRRLLKREKGVNVVILTTREDDDAVYEAFRAGALGYLLKTSTPQDVVEAIRLAERGEAKITPRIATKVLKDFRRTKEEDVEDESDDDPAEGAPAEEDDDDPEVPAVPAGALLLLVAPGPVPPPKPMPPPEPD